MLPRHPIWQRSSAGRRQVFARFHLHACGGASGPLDGCTAAGKLRFVPEVLNVVAPQLGVFKGVLARR